MNSPLLQSMTQTPANDGQIANVIELTNQRGSSIVVMDIGATWLSCKPRLDGGGRREVLLGIGTMTQFQEQSAYMGASVGRYANRIHLGQFSIGDEKYQVSTNQAGNSLHGGEVGFDKRRWKISEQTTSSVTMSIHSEDGDQGFPGNVEASVRYTLTEKNGVEIVYRAQTDKVCPVNLTNHAYFNLQGADIETTCLEHTLQLDAEYYVPIGQTGIPTGEKRAVANSGFDFTKPKLISKDFMVDEDQKHTNGYDHSYVLSNSNVLMDPVATLVSPDEMVTMKVFTNKPAIQLYAGNFLQGTPRREGGVYSNYAGIALETQYLPDSPNLGEWAQYNSLLEPGEEYCFTTVYQFE